MVKLNKNHSLWILAAAVGALLVAGAVGYWLLFQKQQNLTSTQNQLKAAQLELESTQNKLRPLVVFGDTRTGDAVHEQIVNEIFNLNPEAVFHLGDAVEDGNSVAQWQTFNRIEAKLIDNYNFYIAAGNHEHESALFYNNFSLPGNEMWYSVNYQGVHWIVLNSYQDLMPGSAQYTWLENDLAAKRDKIQFTAVVLHQSLFTSAKHAVDTVPYREALIALMQQRGVDVVFSGHDHDYERSLDGKIQYIVCGSAGAPLYEKQYDNPSSQKFVSSYNYCAVDAKNGTLDIAAYDQNATKIDFVSIAATQ